MLQEVCKDVKTEPKLIPLSGETFRLKSTNTRQDTRLDISARGVWNIMEMSFHDGNASNDGPIDQVFRKHEQEKKRVYNDRIIQVEKSTFTPLVFSTSGGIGRETETLHKRLVKLISDKKGTHYCGTMSHVRRKLLFPILRTTLAAIRGFR